MKNLCIVILLITITQQSIAMNEPEMDGCNDDMGLNYTEADYIRGGQLLKTYTNRKIAKFGTVIPSQGGGTAYRMTAPAPLPQNSQHEYITFHDAVKSDDTIAMQKFIDQNRDVVNALNADGDRPLHCAIEYRCLKALALLCQRGANMEAYDAKQQFKPSDFLSYAASEGDRRPMAEWMESAKILPGNMHKQDRGATNRLP